MGTLLFVALHAPGHINPMLDATVALRNKGDNIIFHTGKVFRESIQAAGLRFALFSEKVDLDYQDLLASLKELPPDQAGPRAFARLVGG